MRPIAALALVALLLVPPAQAQGTPRPEYPPELLPILDRVVADAEALATADDRAQPWWGNASVFLERAKEAKEEGRFRVTLFHVETYRELVVGHRLVDAARAAGSGSGKSLVLQNTSGVHDDADAAWLAFRAKLHGYDGELRSLQTIEKALYAGDIGFSGAVMAEDFDTLAEEFPKQDGLSEGYIFGLVRASYTALLNIEWADMVLAKGLEQEGLPPEVVAANWTNLTQTSVAYGLEGDAPAFLEQLDAVADPARANGEGLISVVALVAEQRANRANGMQTIFGDARTRGLDVIADASRGMRRALNNTTLETPRSYGLSGVFTADAIDRAQVTDEYLKTGNADLGTVIIAWASLEYAGYMTNALSSVSPVVPPPTPPPAEKGAPGVPILAVLAIVALAALARRAR